MHFLIRIDQVIIKIEHHYDYIREACEEFIVEEDLVPDITVSVTEEDINNCAQQQKRVFPDSYLEATCFYQILLYRLVSHGYFLMHSVAVVMDQQAYIFMARSGVGKSTHAKLWEKCFPNQAVILNGDKPLFSFKGDVLMVHGSPWKGKERYGYNASVPVKGIAFIERSENNSIQTADEKYILTKLFQQVALPKEQPDLGIFLNFLSKAVKTVPFYRLSCNMEPEAAVIAYKGMNR